MYKRKGFTRQTNGGFTLIELLVVIAIIALLMAILMPALQRVKKQAKTVACRSNLKQWGVVFAMYTGDNDGSFPSGDNTALKDPTGLWMYALRTYYTDGNLRLCPTARKPLSEGAQQPFAAWGPISSYEPGYWPTEPDTPAANYLSYGLNDWVRNSPQKPSLGPGGIDRVPLLWRTPNVKGAGNVPLLLDSSFFGSDPYYTDQPPDYDGNVAVEFNQNEMKRFCLNRHQKGTINGVFVDWSVREIGLKELWKLKWHRKFDVNGPWTKAGGVQPSDWPMWMRRFKEY
jgi:prepilin-type N-terminal cleavage/methylation domain-containing protein